MYIKTEITYLEEFDAWSGAVDTKKKIIEADRGDEFLEALEEYYPDGMTETELNDLLWFEPEVCYEYAGLNSFGVMPISAEVLLGDTTIVDEAIESRIEEYNDEYDTEYTADELGISSYDFESELDDWLSENQNDDTDKDYLAERWLEDEGNVLIDRLVRDLAPDIPEADDHDHGDDC